MMVTHLKGVRSPPTESDVGDALSGPQPASNTRPGWQQVSYHDLLLETTLLAWSFVFDAKAGVQSHFKNGVCKIMPMK